MSRLLQFARHRHAVAPAPSAPAPATPQEAARKAAPAFVALSAFAESLGQTLQTIVNRVDRGAYRVIERPSPHHSGKTQKQIAVASAPEHEQRAFRAWWQKVAPLGADIVDRTLAELAALYGEQAMTIARARYIAVQSYHAIPAKTEIVGATRLPSRAVLDLCRAAAVAPRTLRSWAEAFDSAMSGPETDAARRAMIALVPRHGGQVTRADDRRLRLRPEEALRIQEMYLRTSKPGCAHAFARVIAMCIRCDKSDLRPVDRSYAARWKTHTCPECGFAISYSTVREVVRKIPPAMAALARSGRKAFDDRFARYIARDWSTSHRNDHVFGDHHELDCPLLWDPRQPKHQDGSARYVTLWASAWWDVATGVVALRLVPRPNAESLSLAYRDYVAEYGVPAETWTDNGKDFCSDRFETVALAIGTDLHKCQPSSLEKGVSHARSKPIERWFRTLEDQCVRDFPGWRGPDPTERNRALDARLTREHQEFLDGARDATPLLTLDQARERVNNWIRQQYLKTPQSRQNLSPLDAFAADSRRRRTVGERELDLLLMVDPEPRKIGRNGVRVEGLVYYSRDLFGHEGSDVKVLRDPQDVSKIIVLHEARAIVAYSSAPTGATQADIKAARELARDQRRVAEEYIEVRRQAAAGMKPMDVILAERAAREPSRSAGLAMVSGGDVPIITEAHHIARALDRAPASAGPQQQPKKRLKRFADLEEEQ